jgi:hypothetical protein|eukprot:COSAG06_NODE_32560_length_503_cov_329.747525_1_plen_138_part_00
MRALGHQPRPHAEPHRRVQHSTMQRRGVARREEDHQASDLLRCDEPLLRQRLFKLSTLGCTHTLFDETRSPIESLYRSASLAVGQLVLVSEASDEMKRINKVIQSEILNATDKQSHPVTSRVDAWNIGVSCDGSFHG